MKILTKIYQQNLDCLTELKKTGISEHGPFSSNSVKNKLITTIKGAIYIKIWKASKIIELANKGTSSNNLSSNLQQGKLFWTKLLNGSNVDLK